MDNAYFPGLRFKLGSLFYYHCEKPFSIFLCFLHVWLYEREAVALFGVSVLCGNKCVPESQPLKKGVFYNGRQMAFILIEEKYSTCRCVLIEESTSNYP